MQNVSKKLTSYACHSIWIGPSTIPTEAMFSLYEKAQLYTIECYNNNSFIPTLCLNQDAILNLQYASGSIKLINIVECPASHCYIKEAAKKLINCSKLLEIDLHNNNDIGYMPVLLWEDLQHLIEIKLKTYRPNIQELIKFTKNISPSYLQINHYTPVNELANTMFKYLLNDVIGYLYNIKAYVAASDIIRLLILFIQPGCYSDISDIKIKRLPYKQDFSCDFLTRRKENSLIISLNANIMYNVIFSMYIAIKKNKEINQYTLIDLEKKRIDNIEQLIQAQISFYCKDLETFVHALINTDNFINVNIRHNYAFIQNWLVNHIAGFHFWQSIIGVINMDNYIHGKWPNTETPSISTEIFPGGLEENKIAGCSWNTPGLSFINKLAFLNNILLQDYVLENNIAIQEINNISQKYYITKLEVLTMAMIVGYFYQKYYDAYNIKEKIEEITISAKLKYQELYSIPANTTLFTTLTQPPVDTLYHNHLSLNPFEEQDVITDSINKLKLSFT